MEGLEGLLPSFSLLLEELLSSSSSSRGGKKTAGDGSVVVVVRVDELEEEEEEEPPRPRNKGRSDGRRAWACLTRSVMDLKSADRLKSNSTWEQKKEREKKEIKLIKGDWCKGSNQIYNW
jgi:hypothetical protein